MNAFVGCASNGDELMFAFVNFWWNPYILAMFGKVDGTQLVEIEVER